MTADCRDCGFRFTFDAAFYAERGLRPPRRCKRCRTASPKPRPTRRTATVVSYCGRYGLLADQTTGERFFFSQFDLAAGAHLLPGSPVTFEPDDGAAPIPPGHHPRARAVVPQPSEGACTP
ncbi:MAG: zinc-ribbon domain containing protein [Vicinamibacterales bacterium]